MEDLSDKSKIIYKILEKLDATSLDNKTNAYVILDYLVENAEELVKEEDLKSISEEIILNFSIDATVKGVNTTITSLAKKGLVIKTDPTSTTVNGTTRNLRSYYLQK